MGSLLEARTCEDGMACRQDGRFRGMDGLRSCVGHHDLGCDLDRSQSHDPQHDPDLDENRCCGDDRLADRPVADEMAGRQRWGGRFWA